MTNSILLPVTSFIALPLTLLMVGLALKIGFMRRRYRIAQGSNDNRQLAKFIAAHSNAIENIPLGLLLLGVAEIQGVQYSLLVVCGILLILARSMSAWGLCHHTGHSVGRFYGILLTWIVMIALALLNIFHQIT